MCLNALSFYNIVFSVLLYSIYVFLRQAKIDNLNKIIYIIYTNVYAL